MVNYDSFAHTFSNSRKGLHWPELDSIIEDMKDHGVKSVLDIGCGNGRFLEYIKKNGYSISEYLGIDDSSEMIKEANKLHKTHEFCTFPMEMLENCGPAQRSSPFDAILFLASFHHLDTRDKRIQTLRDTKTFLRPNSRVYMTNWNLRDQSRYDDMQSSEGEYQIKIGEYHRYYHGFTVDELSQLFRETGYTIVENRIFEGGRNLYSIITPSWNS